MFCLCLCSQEVSGDGACRTSLCSQRNSGGLSDRTVTIAYPVFFEGTAFAEASILDTFPTILDYFGLPCDHLAGKSLFQPQ